MWVGLGVTEDEYYESYRPTFLSILARGKQKNEMRAELSKNREGVDSKTFKKELKEAYQEYTKEVVKKADIVIFQ